MSSPARSSWNFRATRASMLRVAAEPIRVAGPGAHERHRIRRCKLEIRRWPAGSIAAGNGEVPALGLPGQAGTDRVGLVPAAIDLRVRKFVADGRPRIGEPPVERPLGPATDGDLDAPRAGRHRRNLDPVRLQFGQQHEAVQQVFVSRPQVLVLLPVRLETQVDAAVERVLDAAVPVVGALRRQELRDAVGDLQFVDRLGLEVASPACAKLRALAEGLQQPQPRAQPLAAGRAQGFLVPAQTEIRGQPGRRLQARAGIRTELVARRAALSARVRLGSSGAPGVRNSSSNSTSSS